MENKVIVIALTMGMKIIRVGAESQEKFKITGKGNTVQNVKQGDSKYGSRLGSPRNSMAAKFGEQREQLNVELLIRWMAILLRSIYYYLSEQGMKVALALIPQSCILISHFYESCVGYANDSGNYLLLRC